MWDFDDPSLSGRLPSEWNAREARRNAERLFTMLQERVDCLVSYLELDRHQSPTALLECVDEHLAAAFTNEEFGTWTSEGDDRHPELTPKGICLCVDAGLLVCALLMDEFGAVLRIEARTKTAKSDAYKNQAELTACDWDYWKRFSIVWMSGVEGASFIRQGLHPNRGFRMIYKRLRANAEQSAGRDVRYSDR